MIKFTHIDQIRPYPQNAKEHPKWHVEKIAASIKALGFHPPIEIDSEGVIISGHGRFMAAKALEFVELRIADRAPKGADWIPISIATDLTEDEVKAKRLADNQLNQLTENDMSLVIGELKDLHISGFDITITGFNLDLITDYNDKEDVVPVILEPKSKLGDIYELGSHLVVCGDAVVPETVKELMKNQKADLVFTDPPYNVDYIGRGKNTETKILNDKMNELDFDAFLMAVFKNYREYTKDGGGYYVFHSSSTQTQFQQAMEKAGLEIKNQIIWNKPMFSLGWGDYQWKHEPLFYAQAKGKTANFYGDRTHHTVLDFHKSEKKLVEWAKRIKKLEEEGKTTIWTMKREPVGDYKHPTQKPVELVSYALFNSSKEGDIVLDFFAGSGSVLIACEKTGRVSYSIELDPRFVDVIVQRWVDYTGIEEIKKNGIIEIWQMTQQKGTSEEEAQEEM